MSITRTQLKNQIEVAQARGYIDSYVRASRATGYSVALLLAKDSRESCLGQCLDTEFKGDNGNGWGLSQVDRRFHSAFTSTTDPRNHSAVVMKGARILEQYDNELGRGIDAALAAYNAGPQNVRDALAAGLPVDAYTTGGDYSADVLRRYTILRDLYPQYDEEPNRAGADIITGVIIGGAVVTYLGLHFYPDAFE